MGIAPLIKWSGGKRGELPLLEPLFPTFERIIEPFAGGAAVSLACAPSQIVLNDISSDLIAFYQTLQQPAQRAAMLHTLQYIDDVRKQVDKDIASLTDQEVRDFYKDHTTFLPFVQKKVKQQTWLKGFAPSFVQQAHKDIAASVKSKLATRIPNLENKTGQAFSPELKKEQLRTAVQAGLYTTLRRVYNHEGLAQPIPSAQKVAMWYAVRSLCYSGMFRYGKNGAFNVPYGGMGYNSRDFATSIRYFKSPEVHNLLTTVSLHNLDFEQLFDLYQGFSEQDFVFVDPPYDSAFSQYNKDQDFTSSDQHRLAKVLESSRAQWMVVVKNTPLMLQLYHHKGWHCYTFDKNYQVNLRSRNERGVEHLIVTNYLPSNTSHVREIT